MRAMRLVRTVGISDPLERNAAELTDKLMRMVGEIKRDAGGKTCGGCRHYRAGGWCAEVLSPEGDALKIGYPSAVACRLWTTASPT